MLCNKKIVVVMPAYNAAKTLERTYIEIPTDLVDEVVLVDDCSTDETVSLAKKIGIKHIVVHEKNLGYGGNQKSCYDYALKLDADIVVMLHPDYQYSPKLIRSMASLLSEDIYDIVMGSRILGKGALSGGMPFYKFFFNRLLTFLENVIINQKLSEYHSGYRAYTHDVLRKIKYHKNSNNFIFDNQFLVQAHFYKFRIAEITCPTNYSKDASSINLIGSLMYGIGCLITAVSYRLHQLKIRKSPLFLDHFKIS
ncbi:MAG: glycosyltransferase family 2 protein [Oligoflexia bacterium]|nr:glycosyltransferase family 2 protein [Oligoflexia bacterium]